MKLKKKKIDKELLSFANSIRGQYIISQALYIASDKLKEIDEDMSNRKDMEYLLKLYNLHPAFIESLGKNKDKLDNLIKEYKKGDKNV